MLYYAGIISNGDDMLKNCRYLFALAVMCWGNFVCGMAPRSGAHLDRDISTTWKPVRGGRVVYTEEVNRALPAGVYAPMGNSSYVDLDDMCQARQRWLIKTLSGLIDVTANLREDIDHGFWLITLYRDGLRVAWLVNGGEDYEHLVGWGFDCNVRGPARSCRELARLVRPDVLRFVERIPVYARTVPDSFGVDPSLPMPFGSAPPVSGVLTSVGSSSVLPAVSLRPTSSIPGLATAVTGSEMEQTLGSLGTGSWTAADTALAEVRPYVHNMQSFWIEDNLDRLREAANLEARGFLDEANALLPEGLGLQLVFAQNEMEFRLALDVARIRYSAEIFVVDFVMFETLGELLLIQSHISQPTLILLRGGNPGGRFWQLGSSCAWSTPTLGTLEKTLTQLVPVASVPTDTPAALVPTDGRRAPIAREPGPRGFGSALRRSRHRLD
jgi:hypothetical protein